MGDEAYRETPPPPALRPFVAALWSYREDAPSGVVQRIVPDGCCELILHLGQPYEEQGTDGAWRSQPTAIFAGQLTRPLALRPAGPLHVIAARFHADGARPWLGRSLVEATDRTLDVTDRMAGEAVADIDDLAAWLESQRREQGWQTDPELRAAIEGEPVEPQTAAARRALQRRFLDGVGVSRQTLNSIRRFRSVFDHAERPDAGAKTWLSAGLDAGYFDQPQIARDFRRFLGCTATAWAREQVELARVIASQSYKTGPASGPQ